MNETTLGRHHAGLSLESLNSMLIHHLYALCDTGGPSFFVAQFRRAGYTGHMTSHTATVVDSLSIGANTCPYN